MHRAFIVYRVYEFYYNFMCLWVICSPLAEDIELLPDLGDRKPFLSWPCTDTIHHAHKTDEYLWTFYLTFEQSSNKTTKLWHTRSDWIQYLESLVLTLTMAREWALAPSSSCACLHIVIVLWSGHSEGSLNWLHFGPCPTQNSSFIQRTKG